MARSPLLKKMKPNKKATLDNLRKQKFAVWDYYRKKTEETKESKKKPD